MKAEAKDLLEFSALERLPNLTLVLGQADRGRRPLRSGQPVRAPRFARARTGLELAAPYGVLSLRSRRVHDTASLGCRGRASMSGEEHAMTHAEGDSGRPGRYRGTLAGDGRPGPIEERIGRRLVRLVDPVSAEGLHLLGTGCVELLGPEGDSLGRVPLREAYRELLERLERRLAEVQSATSAPQDLRDGMDRLEEWSRRMLREPR